MPGSANPESPKPAASLVRPRPSESDYELLFGSNPSPMMLYDTASLKFLAVNDAAIQEYGYSREEFLSSTIRAIHLPEDLPALEEFLAHHASEVRRRGVNRHRRKDGSLMDVEITSTAVRFAGCNARLVLALDITERNRIEQALAAKAAELDALFRALPDLYFQLDFDGRILDYKVGRDQELYLPPEQFMGRKMQEIVPPEVCAEFAGAIDRIKNGDSSATICYQLQMPKGLQDYEARLLPFARDRLVVVIRNITAQMNAERALIESNETLRTLIQTSPLAIIGLDFNGNVHSWNRTAEEMFGWTEAEVLGRPMPIIPADDIDFFRDNVERGRTGYTLAGVERKRRRKDGTLIDVSLWNAPQRDASGKITGLISVIADMRDRKRLEEELRQSQKMEAVGRLAAGVAHDFNNLLTVVTGYSQMLLDKIGPHDPLRPDVEEILKAGNRAATLTSQLLAFGRKQMIQPQVLDLNQVVANMESMLRRIIHEDIGLETVLRPGLRHIKADPGQLEQVLLNLAVNARDAMPKGGTLRIQVENCDSAPGAPNTPERRGEFVCLSVTDTGHGMDEETRSRLFEPFFTTKGVGKGTGLGLSTVYGIVKQHGGDVVVETELGRGTTFRVYFPATSELPEQSQAAGDISARSEPACETILLVEDEASVRRMTRGLLTKQGYQVIEAADGGEALAVYKTRGREIDLLITDVVMPNMNGPELARRLAVLQPGLKIVFLSGYSEADLDDRNIPGAGSSLLVQKPFSPFALAAAVRELLSVS